MLPLGLALSGADAVLSGPCPEHDAQLVQAMAAHASHAAHHHAPGGHHQHKGCSCVGQCCTVVPVSLPAVSVSLTFAITAPAPVVQHDASGRPEGVAHRLPRTRGPPASVDRLT